MLDLIVTGIVNAPVIQLAANIATWCFKQGPKAERAKQRDIIRSTRAALAAERRAAHQAHYEMLRECWDTVQGMRRSSREIQDQLVGVRNQNRRFLQELALTPEQRAAIQECNDQLERGIQRLAAYQGAYLHSFLDEIKSAQQALKGHSFVTPDLPEPVLPDDYPFAGELLEFDATELGDYPFVDLGHSQRGRFITPSSIVTAPSSGVVGLIRRYDKDHGHWVISAAAGSLAQDLSSGDAYRTARPAILGELRGENRIAWWEHESGEKLSIQLEPGAMFRSARYAPWGTPIELYLQGADFFLRQIRGAQTVAREHRYAPWSIHCSATNDFWPIYKAAAEFSDKLLIRESGMSGDPRGADLVLRLATGQEYPIELEAGAKVLRIGPQCGARLGLLQESGKNFLVFLFQGCLVQSSAPDSGSLASLRAAIQESFEEQRDLIRLADADNLELQKYRAVLQAEFETSRNRGVERVDFQDWQIPEGSPSGGFLVRFITTKRLSPGTAVQLSGEENILGWCAEVSEADTAVVVKILHQNRRAFREGSFPSEGRLEAVQVNRELQNKIDAIENFLSAAVAESRTLEDQRAFTILRRELLGTFLPASDAPPLSCLDSKNSQLDEHQGRAVSLLASGPPLVLIQGPPGTGKTHVIAHAVDQILKANPKARVAITSQANPAVDEAIAKIQEAFPKLQIYRDYSATAKEKYSSLNRGVAIDQYREQLLTRLENMQVNPEPRISHIQEWFKTTLKNDITQMERDMRQILAQRSQIIACTLSRLALISASAPPFDLVIVDEAAKASVPETMIAANCAKRLALVGDHCQLLPYLDESFYEHSAPSERDKELLKQLWNDSLFSRLWRNAPESRKAFLKIMRRSREPIAACISFCFYKNELIPGRDHSSKSLRFPISLMWVDSRHGRHSKAGMTTINNPAEVRLVFQCCEELRKLSIDRTPLSVAVIAFHRGQAELLTRSMNNKDIIPKPSVLTVDASQGGQWDVVILSLGRTHGFSGFVGNPNRMNVAISRAKELCIVVGSLDYAMRDRSADSYLRLLARYFKEQPPLGKWISYPDSSGAIGSRFGFPPKKAKRQ
jgi:Cdc6-like AAA superfamily ATPase